MSPFKVQHFILIKFHDGSKTGVRLESKGIQENSLKILSILYQYSRIIKRDKHLKLS